MHLYLLGKMRKARRFIWGDNVPKQADRGFSGILSDFELCISVYENAKSRKGLYERMWNTKQEYVKRKTKTISL